MSSFHCIYPDICQYRTLNQATTFFYDNIFDAVRKFKGRVYHFPDKKNETFPVTLPQELIATIPAEKSTPSKQVRWLLRNHYHPIIQNKALSFHQSPQRLSLPSITPCLERTILALQETITNPFLEGLTCPITQERFQEPYITNCGHTFEKKAIETWKKDKDSCPQCREKIVHLTPN